MPTFAHCIQIAFIPPSQRLLRYNELSEEITDSIDADPQDIVITPWCGDGYPDWDFRLTAFAEGRGDDDISLVYGNVGFVEVDALSHRFSGCLRIERFKSRFLGQRQFARHLQSYFKALTVEQSLDIACLAFDELFEPYKRGRQEVPQWFIDKALKKDCEWLHIADCSGGIYMRLRERDLNDFDRCVFADRRTNPLVVTGSWYSYADPDEDFMTYDAYKFDDWAEYHIYGAEPD
jgi:hypothetical protein